MAQDVVALAAKLLRVNSVTGGERQLAALAKELFLGFGFDEARIDKAGNVVAVIRGNGGPKLLFDAHIDTVGLGDEEKWSVPPLSGTVRDGRLYGRGASDMKGAFAAMMAAGAQLVESGRRPPGDVVISGTVNEETAEGRCIEVVLDDEKPDCVVIGEASEMNVKIGQRGRAEILMEACGRSAHSSNPDRGVNAIERLCAAIAAIRAGVPEKSHPLLGKGIMVITDIISDPYPGISVIPDKAKCTYDRRLLPGEGEADVLAELHAALGALCEGEYPVKVCIAEEVLCTYNGHSFRNKKFFPAWELPEADAYVATALAAVHGAGVPAKLTAYSFCTNGSSTAGVYGIPTIGFGPGTEKDAHTIDESIGVEELKAAEAGYRALMEMALRASDG